MRYAGHAARMEDTSHSRKILIRKSEVKRPLARTRRRCEDNDTMVLKEIGGKVWTGFIWLRIGTSGGIL
jgi:hypothetical protein